MSEPKPLPVIAMPVDFGNSRVFCPKCGSNKRLDEFPILPNGALGAQCLACVRNTQAQRNIAKREALANQALGKYFDAVNAATAKTPRMSPLLEALFDKFGNTSGFVDRFAQQLEAAEAQSPGGKHVLDAYKGIMQMVQANDRTLPPPVDVGSLTDDELEKLLKRQVHEELQALETDNFEDDDDAAEPPI